MRKIEREACEAFIERRNWKLDNTEVRIEGEFVEMYLHGNLIAIQNFRDSSYHNWISVSTCGWDTNTTRSRIHRLLCWLGCSPVEGGGCGKRKGQLMLCGQPWDGRTACVDLPKAQWNQLPEIKFNTLTIQDEYAAIMGKGGSVI